MKNLASTLALCGALAVGNLPLSGQANNSLSSPDLTPQDIIVDVYNDIIKPVSTPEVVNASFEMFPNPCQDYLIVDFSEEGWRELEVYNLLGEKLRSYISKGERAHLKVEDLIPGYYFLKINDQVFRFQKT